MIRRPGTDVELGLDSLTDMMTNMMGLVLLMVAIASIMSGGMKISLINRWTDPGDRTPIHLVCTRDRILFMHRNRQWQDELTEVCRKLQVDLGRQPTTSEALLAANQAGLRQSPDFAPQFVREVARERGRDVYLIGVRFLSCENPVDSFSESSTGDGDRSFTRSASQALDDADPATEYIDAFVYEDAFEALQVLQREAKARRLELGWRPLLRDQDPGLSEHGTRGRIGGNQ